MCVFKLRRREDNRELSIYRPPASSPRRKPEDLADKTARRRRRGKKSALRGPHLCTFLAENALQSGRQRRSPRSVRGTRWKDCFALFPLRFLIACGERSRRTVGTFEFRLISITRKSASRVFGGTHLCTFLAENALKSAAGGVYVRVQVAAQRR